MYISLYAKAQLLLGHFTGETWGLERSPHLPRPHSYKGESVALTVSQHEPSVHVLVVVPSHGAAFLPLASLVFSWWPCLPTGSHSSRTQEAGSAPLGFSSVP